MEDMPKEVQPAKDIPADPIPTEEDYQVRENAITPFEGDYMTVTVEVADHLEKYEKAIDTIMNFIIRRTYAGDWVSHDKSNTPLEERTVNMIGAAAERVARDLGMSEKNRTTPAKRMYDQEKHPGHYYYECEGDFTFRGRTIHAVGRASTLNPFHLAKAGGDPGKIREEYIVQECWRDCTKNGIRGWFGLRKIPIMKLKELGYDISKVKFVNFQSKEGSQSEKNPQATAKPEGAEEPVAGTEKITITLESVEDKLTKTNKKPFSSVKDIEGVTYYVWGPPDSKLVVQLKEFLTSNQPVTVMVKSGQYPTIISVVQ